MNLKLNEIFLAELEREAVGTRKALERVPEGQHDFKPHEKSMPLGYLASLVAAMPEWIDFMINRDELDFAPAGNNPEKPKPWTTRAELLSRFEAALAKAKAALKNTTDEHLMTNWKLKAHGQLISDEPRYINIRHGMMNHWVHHRGQLTVYLRLNEAAVPALYGPSADERF